MYQHFDQTLKEFGITGKRLSEVTGFSMAHISAFRHGKTNPSCETLEKLLEGAENISPGSRVFFCQLLAGDAIKPMQTDIRKMDNQQLAVLLQTIADKLESQSPVLEQELMSA
jgi:transcriptional regulator with XRE-family HTH domain